jgi:hypothetical protein
MLDQSFNYENFRAIYDQEKRKGLDLDARFFPEIAKQNAKIKDSKKRKSFSDEEQEKYSVELKEKELLIQKKLEEVCQKVREKKYVVDIQRTSCPKGKAVFTLSKESPEDFFCMKQMQSNIRKCYKVVQSDRLSIVKQLKGILSDSVPKTILRIDIKKFYENIPNDKILEFINSEPILCASTRRLICSLIRQHNEQMHTNKGIPRGLGISAYLAELYMRSFDREIRSDNGVLYYARYVDDIVVVFLGKVAQEESRNTLDRKLKKLDLEIHSEGDKFTWAYSKGKEESFNYLGYQLKLTKQGVRVGISTLRGERIRKRLKATFEDYMKARGKKQEEKEKLFVNRIKFLTSNTKLYNSKKSTAVGVYFSNQLIDDFDQLRNLDEHLEDMKGMLPARMQIRVKRYGFEKGFASRKFVNFSTQELSEIVKVWKYES